MHFNQFGDLYKCEIVTALRKKGVSINSVHELNLLSG